MCIRDRLKELGAFEIQFFDGGVLLLTESFYDNEVGIKAELLPLVGLW